MARDTTSAPSVASGGTFQHRHRLRQISRLAVQALFAAAADLVRAHDEIAVNRDALAVAFRAAR